MGPPADWDIKEPVAEEKAGKSGLGWGTHDGGVRGSVADRGGKRTDK